ncbi:hypothetical protein ACLOJK_033103 [Asimina triloba]
MDFDSGDSSFNQLIYELSKDSDTSSSEDFMSAEEDDDADSDDLQLSMEIFIEAVFDMVHKAANYLLSPSEAFCILFRQLSSCFSRKQEGSDGEASVLIATLGDVDPSPNEKQIPFLQSSNTDARTCQDVITELG